MPEAAKIRRMGLAPSGLWMRRDEEHPGSADSVLHRAGDRLNARGSNLYKERFSQRDEANRTQSALAGSLRGAIVPNYLHRYHCQFYGNRLRATRPVVSRQVSNKPTTLRSYSSPTRGASFANFWDAPT